MSPFGQLQGTAFVTTPLDAASWSPQRAGKDAMGASPTRDLMELHRAIGGCLTLQAMAQRFQTPERQLAVLLDRWVSSGRVQLLPGTPEVLVPAFQIDLERRAPFPSVGATLAVLTDVFGPVQRVEWFVTPNLWLADEMPARLLAHDPRAVLGAARADRFITLDI
jgi:hypothetical protein